MPTSPYAITQEIDFTHNVGRTIQDIEKRLAALSSKPINIPVNLGKIPRMGFGGGAQHQLSLTKGYSKARNELILMHKTIGQVNGEIGKLGYQASVTAKRFLAFAGVTTVFLGFANAVRSGVGAAIQYEKAFSKIAQVTGTSIKDLGALDREVTRLSTSLGVGSKSISEIGVTLAQAGLTARETTKALDVLAKTELSATFGDIKNTTEGAIAIMAQFGTGADELARQLSAVNTIAAKFAVESEDLVEVTRKAGGAFRASGGEYNELLALFTSVRATTRESAESIATGLRTIFTRLQRTRTINFLDKLGIDLKNAKGEFIGIYPAIEKLSVALEGVSGTDTRFNQIVEELGGFRQVSKVIPLLKQFGTAQKALSAAKRSENSIDKDVIVSQKTLENQYMRVKEEFLALTRSYYNDGGLRTFISGTLSLASALIKVGEAIRPLIPLMSTLATFNVLQSFDPFIRGVLAQHSPTVVKKRMSSGGPVPGSGNGDTVPAYLEPGEFVVRKRAVQAFGIENLHKINHYAQGGKTKKNVITPSNIKKALYDFQNDTGIDPSGLVNRVNIGKHPKKSIRGGFLPTSKIISLYKSTDRIGSYTGLKKTLYHELAHALDVAKSGDNYIYRSLSKNHLNNAIGESFFQNYDEGYLTSLARKKQISQEHLNYRTQQNELFANGFAYRYTGNKNSKIHQRFVKSSKKYFDALTTAVPQLIKRNGYVPEAKGIDNILPKGYFKIDPMRKGALRRFAIGGPVRYLRNSIRSIPNIDKLIGPKTREVETQSLRSLFTPSGFRESLGIAKGDNSLSPIFSSDFLYGIGRTLSPQSFRVGAKKLSRYFNRDLNSFLPLSQEERIEKGNNLLKQRAKNAQRIDELIRINNTKTELGDKKTQPANNLSIPSKLRESLGIEKGDNSLRPIFSKNFLYGIGRTLSPQSFRVGLKKLSRYFNRDISSFLPLSQKEMMSRRDMYLQGNGNTTQTTPVIKENNSLVKSASTPITKSTHASQILLNSKKRTKNLTNRQDIDSVIFGDVSISPTDKVKILKQAEIERQNKINGILKRSQEKPQRRIKKKKSVSDDLIDFRKYEVDSDLIDFRKYAKGGGVGGHGNTDRVPSLLTPGEFVINKKSAQAFGYNNLDEINKQTKAKKYALGGKVGLGVGAAFVAPQILQSISGGKDDTLNKLASAASVATTALLAFSFGIKRDGTSVTNELTQAQDRLNTAEANFKKNREEGLDKLRTGRDIYKTKRDDLVARITAEKANRAAALAANTANPNGPQTVVNTGPIAEEGELRRLDKQRGRDARKGFDFYKNIEEKNKEAIKAAKIDVDLYEKKKKQDEMFNDSAGKIAIASTVLLTAGTLFQEYTNKLILSGNKNGNFGLGTANEAGIGGLLTGAGTGALIGSYVGGMTPIPGGTVIGAAAGGLLGGAYGGVKEYSGAKSSLKAYDLRKSFDSLENTLNNVAKGRSLVKDVRGSVNNSLFDLNKRFFETTDDEFVTFQGAMSSSADGLEYVFNESLKAATSIADFTKENDSLILALSRFGGYSIPEIEKKIKTEIETRAKSSKLEEMRNDVILESARRLESTFTIITALNSAESSVSEFTNRLDKLGQISSNSFAQDKTGFNFSALSNISTSREQDVNRQADQAAKFIGDSKIAEDIKQASSISARLPGILNDLVLKNQLEGDELIDGLKKQLGSGFAANLAISAVGKEIGNTEDSTKFLTKFKENPIEVTKTIQAALQPTADALAEALPRIVNEFDSFADGLAISRANFFNQQERLNKVVDINQVKTEFNNNAFGKRTTFSEENLFDTERKNRFTNGLTATDIGGKLTSSQQNILTLSKERDNANNPKTVKELTQAISDNILEAEKSTKALEFLADVNSRLATVEKERSRLSQIRENKTMLAKDFVFGNSQDKLGITKGLFGAKKVLSNLDNNKSPLTGLNDELKQGALKVFEQFNDADIFGGLTGKEVINKILEKEGFNTKPDNKESELINAGNAIIAEAKAAQELLNANSSANNKAFLDGLGSKFDQFFSNLEKFFIEDKNKKKEEANRDVSNRIEEIDRKIANIKKVAALVGVNPKDPISNIENNAGLATQFNRKQAELQQLSDARLGIMKGRRDATKVVDTQNLTRLALPPDVRNKLDKDVFRIKSEDEETFNRGRINTIQNKDGSFRLETQIENKNRRIEEVVVKALDEVQNQKMRDKQGLLEQIGVPDEIKAQFIKGAEEAVKILKDGDISKNIVDYEKEKIGLKATLRARGGSVFSARGTDTVPAMTTDGKPYMLTPGETIMNVDASRKFGKILRAMNTGYLAKGGRVPRKSYTDAEIERTNKLASYQIQIENNKRRLQEIEKQAIQNKMDFDDKMSSISSQGIARREASRNYRFVRKYDSNGDLINRTKTSDRFTSEEMERNAKRAKMQQYLYGNKGGNLPSGSAPYKSSIPSLPIKQKPTNSVKQPNQKPIQQNQNNSGINQPVVNSTIVSELNKIVDKLNGLKVTLQIAGTVNVNINSPNLAQDITDKFKPVMVDYVNNEVTKAINNLIKEASLGVAPKMQSKKGDK